MQYRNNLSDIWGNSYFEVVEPFKVYIKVGISKSNTFIGSSMMYGNVYEHVTLEPGDEIHDLHGGVYAIIDGEPYKAYPEISEKHPFEKSYGTHEEQWPVKNLRKITEAKARKPKGGYHREDPIISPGKYIGRSIDSVITR